MALFLIIAIGTDDIFVFMDTWYQSQTKGTFVNSCLLNRMNWVYRRACKAMFDILFFLKSFFFFETFSLTKIFVY